MKEFTTIELEAAQKAIASIIRKNEKAKETLSQKQSPCTSQKAIVSQNLKVSYLASALIEKALKKDYINNYQEEELREALHIIPLLTQKIEKVMPKFKEGTPQHTIAIRRISAFHIVSRLIEYELGL